MSRDGRVPFGLQFGSRPSQGSEPRRRIEQQSALNGPEVPSHVTRHRRACHGRQSGFRQRLMTVRHWSRRNPIKSYTCPISWTIQFSRLHCGRWIPPLRRRTTSFLLSVDATDASFSDGGNAIGISHRRTYQSRVARSGFCTALLFDAWSPLRIPPVGLFVGLWSKRLGNCFADWLYRCRRQFGAADLSSPLGCRVPLGRGWLNLRLVRFIPLIAIPAARCSSLKDLKVLATKVSRCKHAVVATFEILVA